MKIRPVRTEEIRADLTNQVVAIRNKLENLYIIKLNIMKIQKVPEDFFHAEGMT